MLAWLYPPARPPGLGRGPQFLATRELSVTGLLPQFAQETSQPWKPGHNFSGENGDTEPGNDLNKALRETPPSPAVLYSPCDAHPSPIGADLVSLEDSRAGTLLASRCGHHELRLLVVRLSGRSRLLGGLPPAPSGRRQTCKAAQLSCIRGHTQQPRRGRPWVLQRWARPRDRGPDGGSETGKGVCVCLCAHVQLLTPGFQP